MTSRSRRGTGTSANGAPTASSRNPVQPESVGRLMVMGYRRFESIVLDELRKHAFDDIRPTHLSVLIHIPIGGIRTSEVAVLASMTRQAVGQIASQLEDMGYLIRRLDPADGRARILEFTEKGRRLWQASWDISSAAKDRLAGLLGAERLEMLCASLKMLADADMTGPSAERAIES